MGFGNVYLKIRHASAFGIRESDETPLLFEVYVMSSSSECICVIGESI